MMFRSMRLTAKNVLRRCRIDVRRMPIDEVGFHLDHDLRRLITGPAPVLFDIGANRGQTIEWLSPVFPQARIYSFEPARDSFLLLQAKPRPQNVTIYNLALGAECGRADLRNYEYSTLNSFLEMGHGTNNPFREQQLVKTESVEVTTVDQFVREQGLTTIDLLKSDTQGFELDVLRGAVDCLKRGLINNVLVEICFVKLYQHQPPAEAIQQFLAEYNLFLIDYYEKVRVDNRLAWCTALFSKCEDSVAAATSPATSS
jgi:FkbM family methyltransferase